eukprot:6218082-Amphidinium_carterae.3
MAHGDSIQFHPVISSSKGEKSDEHVPKGNKSRSESSVKVYPVTNEVVRPTSLDGARKGGMDELDAQTLRDAVRASAGAVNLVNAMVGDRLSSVRDAKSMPENSEELVARATFRKREEQGVPSEGQTKQLQVEIDEEQRPSTREPEGARDGRLADNII